MSDSTTGGIIGTAVGGPILGGEVMSFMGGQDQAKAQGQAAQAQLSAAQQQRQVAVGAAMPSVDELTAIHAQNQQLVQANARQEALLNTADPALMEAGRQALQLLNGKQAPVLAPMQAEQDRQRQLLINQLGSQLGPGAIGSTAGSEALNRFNQSSQLSMAQAQQGALGQLLQTTAQTRPNPYTGAEIQAQQNQNLIQNLGNLQNRQVSAINATPITPYAGAPFVGAALAGQQANQFGNNLANLGLTIGTAAMKGGAGA